MGTTYRQVYSAMGIEVLLMLSGALVIAALSLLQ
jgi:hypothetical protein